MDRDYAGVIKKKLDDVYRTHGSGTAAKGEKESRQSFIVRHTSAHGDVLVLNACLQILLNDLDISSLHMERLIKELCSSVAITQNFMDSEVDQVKNSISSFTNLVPRFRSTLRVSERHYLVFKVDLTDEAGRSRTAIQPATASETAHVHSGCLQGRIIRSRR